MPNHIVFVGAGAVGCFYASRLHHPEHDVHVSLIARSNYAAIAKSGVRLETHSFGTYTFRPRAAYASVSAAAPASPSSPPPPPPSSAAPPPRWDYIVVTTKALPDRGDDSALIAPLVGPDTCIVLIQNGVGVEDPYRRRFPRNPIVSAVTIISAEQISSGVVRQNRWTRIHLGPYTDSAADVAETPTPSKPSATSGTSSPQHKESPDAMRHVERLHHWWTTYGQIRDVEMHGELDLQVIRWHKLTINAAMNPSSILSGGLGPAAMIADPNLKTHLRGVMDEIWAAAPIVLGRPFPKDLATPERVLASAARNTEGRPSMLIDWEGGRPLETEVILGNPVRMAMARGVQMPRVQAMYALLRSMSREREGRRARDSASGKL